MVHLEQIDSFQLRLIIQVFYQERVLHKYLLAILIHVLLQMIQIHIVGEAMSNYFNFFKKIKNKIKK
jgi:hypothetical protein